MPLSFVHPALIAGTMSVVVPWLAHRMGGPRRNRLPFAPVAWLQPLGTPTPAPRRVANWPLLLLRMALLLAAVLSVAHPQWPPSKLGVAAGPTKACALIIDRSASMGYVHRGTTLLAQARAQAHAAVHSLPPQTPIAVWPVPPQDGQRVTAAPLLSVTDAHALIDRLTLADAGLAADMGAAVHEAEAWIHALGSPGKVVVIGDLSRHSFPNPAAPPVGPEAAAQTALVWLDAAARATPAGEPPQALANVAVQSIAPGGADSVSGTWVTVRLHNFGEAAVRGRGITLSVDGEVVQRGFVDLPPRAALNKVMALPTAPRGEVRVEARLDAAQSDGFVADDSVVSRLVFAPPVRLWAVDSADGGGAVQRGELYFAERALAQVPANAGGFEITLVPRANLTHALATAQAAPNLPMDALILANVGDLTAAEARGLAALSRRHVGLIVTLGDHVLPDDGAAIWSEALPFTLRDIYSAAAPTTFTGPSAWGEPVADIQENHPIIQPLGEAALAGLRASRTRKYMHVAPVPGEDSQVVMAYATHAPALLVAPANANRGPVLVWTTSLDVDWSDVPLAQAFVPWLQQVVRYAGRGGELGSGAAAKESGQAAARRQQVLQESDFAAIAPAAWLGGRGAGQHVVASVAPASQDGPLGKMSPDEMVIACAAALALAEALATAWGVGFIAAARTASRGLRNALLRQV